MQEESSQEKMLYSVHILSRPEKKSVDQPEQWRHS